MRNPRQLWDPIALCNPQSSKRGVNYVIIAQISIVRQSTLILLLIRSRIRSRIRIVAVVLINSTRRSIGAAAVALSPSDNRLEYSSELYEACPSPNRANNQLPALSTHKEMRILCSYYYLIEIKHWIIKSAISLFWNNEITYIISIDTYIFIRLSFLRSIYFI